MIPRLALMTVAAGLSNSLAAAQQPLPTQPVQASARSLGTYHAASGTWSRDHATPAFGPDVIYNNAGSPQYVAPLLDDAVTRFRITDSGRVPSLEDTGDGCAYVVDGFRFGYCSAAGLGSALNVDFEFRDQLGPCIRPTSAADESFVLNGLPSSASAGTQACWILTVDLAGSTGDFVLTGDGDTLFDGQPSEDNFGWTFAFSGHGTDTTTGPISFGDPTSSPFGAGTTNFGYGVGPDGTGLGQHDMFWLDSVPLQIPGCRFFGGFPLHPWGGFYLRLFGRAESGACPSSYCTPGGPNSVAPGGAQLSGISGFGTSQARFDLFDVPDQPGLLYAGDQQIQAPFGCGERCVGGNVTRGPVVFPNGNQALDVSFDMSAPSARHVQYWYRDPANFGACGAAFNLSNAVTF